MSYYDASFVALAIKYGAILVTQNVKHQKKVGWSYCFEFEGLEKENFK